MGISFWEVDRVTTHKTKGQRGGAVSIDPKKRSHHRFQKLTQIPGHPQFYHQVGAMRDGIKLCGNVILPSLFPFFVLSSLVVELGMSRYLGKLL